MERSLLAPGHRACAGCAMPTTIRLVLDAAGPNTIVVSPTGCLEVVTTPFPESAWCVPWIHSLFENPAAVASGVEVMLKRRGRDTNVVVIGGDGSTFDIGMGSNSGMFERGHKVLYVCYDNEAYMNTGVQRSGSTPFCVHTTTTPSGSESMGNPRPKKDMPAIALGSWCALCGYRLSGLSGGPEKEGQGGSKGQWTILYPGQRSLHHWLDIRCWNHD